MMVHHGGRGTGGRPKCSHKAAAAAENQINFSDERTIVTKPFSTGH